MMMIIVKLDVIRLPYKNTCSCVEGRENIDVFGVLRGTDFLQLQESVMIPREKNIMN